MSDSLIVTLTFLGVYGLIVAYAAYIHVRVRRLGD